MELHSSRKSQGKLWSLFACAQDGDIKAGIQACKIIDIGRVLSLSEATKRTLLPKFYFLFFFFTGHFSKTAEWISTKRSTQTADGLE